MVKVEQIKKSPLFLNLSSDEVEDVLSNIYHTLEYHDKNEILAMQDELCNRLIILVEGSVKAEMVDPAGKVVKVEDLSAPNPLAILFLFGKNNRFPVQVTTIENVLTLTIPKSSLLKMLSYNEKILINFLDISAKYANMLSKKLHLMSFRTIRQKLAIYFLDLAQNDKEKVKMDLTQTALAEYFGVSRPSLSRELSNMQTEGLIVFDKKEIIIPDRNKLVRLVSF